MCLTWAIWAGGFSGEDAACACKHGLSSFIRWSEHYVYLLPVLVLVALCASRLALLELNPSACEDLHVATPTRFDPQPCVASLRGEARCFKRVRLERCRKGRRGLRLLITRMSLTGLLFAVVVVVVVAAAAAVQRRRRRRRSGSNRRRRRRRRRSRRRRRRRR